MGLISRGSFQSQPSWDSVLDGSNKGFIHSCPSISPQKVTSQYLMGLVVFRGGRKKESWLMSVFVCSEKEKLGATPCQIRPNIGFGMSHIPPLSFGAGTAQVMLPKPLSFSLPTPHFKTDYFSPVFNHWKFHYNNNFRVLPINSTITVAWANKCSAVGLGFISPGKWLLPHKQEAPPGELMTPVPLTLHKLDPINS